MTANFLDSYDDLFITPECTEGKYSFGDINSSISFNDAEVIIFGIPLDVTSSFGQGSSKGPEAIRKTSARQIETFLFEEKIDIKDRIKIYDLGDIYFPTDSGIEKLFSYLDNVVPSVINDLILLNKKPVILGGEHTISYFCLKPFYRQKPLLIHFDAHRDLKPMYDGMKLCHTTHFFRLIEEGYLQGNDLIQIGIRQADEKENKIAEEFGVVTFDSWTVKDDLKTLLKYINSVTNNRKIYISFDVDVFDLAYVPCTGTPEPFGLDPFEVIKILKSINMSANLLGMDLVETSHRNGDYREGTLSSQILLRILSRDYVRHV
jgi:agmatinase